MNRRNYLYLFVTIMSVLFVFSAAIGLYASWQNVKGEVAALEAEKAQEELAHEKCLQEGYPDFLVVNGNFYCAGTTQDGEIRIKQIVLE